MRFGNLIVVLATLVAAGCAPSSPAPPSAQGEEPPQRILSLVPNVTEILFELGLGKRIVARSNFCDYPPEAQAIPPVGDTLSLNQEKILSLRPTIAFLSTRRQDLPRTLEGMGIRTVPLEFDRLTQLYASITTIGREVDRETLAKELNYDIQVKLMTVRGVVKDRPRPRTLFAFPMTLGSTQMMVAGRGTFVDDLLEAAGAENAYPDAADWPTITPERAIALAPDVVIINATGAEATPDRIEAVRKAWANWTSIPAVANKRVYVLTDNCLTIPGPRIVLAAWRISKVLHPDAWTPREGLPPPPFFGAPEDSSFPQQQPGAAAP